MSNPQQQAPQGQAQPQQQQGGPQLLKPDDLSKLQCLSDDQKQKYRPVLQNFWQMMQTKPAGTPEHIQAGAKLREWSTKLITQERSYRARMKAQGAQQAATQQPSQTSQVQQNQQASQPSSAQSQQPAQQQQQTQNMKQDSVQAPAGPQQQASPAQGGQPNPQQQQQQQQQPQVNPQIMKHVNEFPYALQPPPAGPAPGTQEYQNKIKEQRNTYMLMLVKQEKATANMRAYTNLIEQRSKQNQGVPPELVGEREKAQNTYNSAKRWIEEFRKRQSEWGSLSKGGPVPQMTGAQQAQPNAQNAQPQPSPALKQEPQIKIEGGQQPTPQAQFGNMQGAPQPNAGGMQNIQAPRPPPQPHSQQPGSFTQQPGPPRPQINPQQANASMQQQNNSPHPQSATSNPNGLPVPLTHQAAVSAAQRSYSQSDPRTGTPMQPGPGSFHATRPQEREQLNNPKMPIPRTLNTTSPTPVVMGGGGRPTLAGPTNGAPGVMGQPAINRMPAFQLEGEGDRVLSKRKLDELVRQVTGGTEDALTPEVEEAMLALADEFVDNVITNACKLSKLRESSNLEIRDLQCTIERNYNIRIPGYASDEVRTVRKLVPAAGWTQKMNAVQAAKVMGGGKTDA